MSGAAAVEKEILDWIEAADEPKDKALLMILYRMNASLTENTAFTREIAEDFTEHKTRVERLVNMGAGGRAVGMFAFVLVQGLCLYIANREITLNEVQEHRLAVLEARMLREESKR